MPTKKHFPNQSTLLAYIDTRKKTKPYEEIMRIANGEIKGIKDAIMQYCEQQNARGIVYANGASKFPMDKVDFGFIAEHWPYEKMTQLTFPSRP